MSVFMHVGARKHLTRRFTVTRKVFQDICDCSVPGTPNDMLWHDPDQLFSAIACNVCSINRNESDLQKIYQHYGRGQQQTN